MSERFLDVSHEALIRGWPRLRGWLDEDRAGLRVQRRITETAAEWQRSNRDNDLLYRGARLVQAQEWRTRHEVELNPLEREFLDASIELKQRLEEHERELQQRELEAAQKLAEAERRRAKYVIGTFALAVTLIVAVWGGYYLFVQEHPAYYREFAKRHGFPVGIGQIFPSEARRLPFSFRLIHKGIVRDRLRFQWKPAFRVEAIDSLLKPTTHHSVGTYLWKPQSNPEDTLDYELWDKKLGPQNVCEWEFVSTEQKGKIRILYERALDRDGRMVHGLIYSPLELGATRLARYVDPNGFPQVPRHSAAEYMMIHYDKEGWEDRIMYRDSKNLPAAGPDGAFGQSRRHNHAGQVTHRLSLDAEGHPMIDKTGNCGMEFRYDEKGQILEQKSLGPDLRPMPLKDGYVIVRDQNDHFGRPRREAFHGVNGEPVLHKDGYHGWETQYDERGNRIVLTYHGLDGKPTLLADGYATRKSIYDARGNVTRQSYYGVKGEQVLHKQGYHGWEAQYDERGNLIAITYLGTDEKPILLVDGYSTVRSTYDVRGNMTRQSYHGVNEEPIVDKNGHHSMEFRYDERGNQIERIFFGLDGKPLP
jgi:hypothetical protein